MQHTGKEAQIEILKRKIADLKNRLPAHSVKPRMLQELEQLEEELEALTKGKGNAERRQ